MLVCVGQTQAETTTLTNLGFCFHRAEGLNILERGKAKDDCVNAVLSQCKRSTAATECLSTLESTAVGKAEILTRNLQQTYPKVLATHDDLSKQLFRWTDVIGSSACDDGGAFCDAASAVWVYAGLIDFSRKLEAISEGNQ